MHTPQAKAEESHDVLTNEPERRAPAVFTVSKASIYPHVVEPFDAVAVIEAYKRGDRMEHIIARYGTYFVRIYKLLYDAKLTMRNGQPAYLTAEECEVALRMRKAGTSVKVLRLIFDVHTMTMRIALARASGRRNGLTQELRDSLTILDREGLSYNEIAQRLHSCTTRVKNWYRQMDNEQAARKVKSNGP